MSLIPAVVPASQTRFTARVFFRVRLFVIGFLCQALAASATAQSVSLLKDINTDGTSKPLFMTRLGNRALVLMESEYGTEPWITDGTLEGTRLVRDIRAGSASSIEPPTADVNKPVAFAATLGDTALFVADDGGPGAPPFGGPTGRRPEPTV